MIKKVVLIIEIVKKRFIKNGIELRKIEEENSEKRCF